MKKEELMFRVFCKNRGYYCFGFYMVVNQSGVCYEEDVSPKHNSEIDDLIVERATGVRDKNNRMIYVGDIVKVPDDYETYGFMSGEEREVYFFDGAFRLKPNSDTFHKNCRGHVLEGVDGELEVVSNINVGKEILDVEA